MHDISHILYALLAQRRFFSAELINQVDAFFHRLAHFGYLCHYITVIELNLIMNSFSWAILGTHYAIYSHLLDQMLI